MVFLCFPCLFEVLLLPPTVLLRAVFSLLPTVDGGYHEYVFVFLLFVDDLKKTKTKGGGGFK